MSLKLGPKLQCGWGAAVHMHHSSSKIKLPSPESRPDSLGSSQAGIRDLELLKALADHGGPTQRARSGSRGVVQWRRTRPLSSVPFVPWVDSRTKRPMGMLVLCNWVITVSVDTRGVEHSGRN